MKRKLVQQGPSTLMISLPAKWVQKNNLKKGEEVGVEEDENVLRVSAEEKQREQKEVIDVSGLSPLVNRAIISLYIQGVDELEVNFKSRSEIEDFKKRVINELLGFEIIKQSQDSMLLKDVTGTEKQEVDSLIKRIFFILDSMIEELVLAAEKRQKMSPVIEIDSSVNKFVNFCLRILNKKGYQEFSKTMQIYGVLHSLEEVGDNLKKIAKEAEKQRLSKDQIDTIKESRTLLKMFEEIMFSFSKEKMVACAKKYESIKNKIKGKDLVTVYLYQLLESTIKINNDIMIMSL